MRFVLDILYFLAVGLASPWILYRLVREGGWSLIPGRLGLILPERSPATVWLHGSSVGEVSLLGPLIAELESGSPDYQLVISSFTRAGVAAARARYAAHTVLPLPFDWTFVVGRVLRRVMPKAIVVVESDIWPNFVSSAQRLSIPVAVINAKMSERSVSVYARARVFAPIFARLSVVAAQTVSHAQRFESLGVPKSHVWVTGNMKYDLTPPPDSAGMRERFRRQLGISSRDVVVIGASLHLPEDEAVLDAYAMLARVLPSARLIIVPRYPADGRGMAAHATERGFDPCLRSAGATEGVFESSPAAVLIADTLGELRALYHVADIAFVGGSLFDRGANKGGHNLMEPAILGIPVLFGPYNYSFRETVSALLDAKAGLQVESVDDLATGIHRLCVSESDRHAFG